MDISKKFYTCRYDRPFKEVMLKDCNQDILIQILEMTLKVKVFEILEKNIERNQRNIHIRRKNLDILLSTSAGIIGIEMNSGYASYLRARNFAFFCDIYSSETLVGEEYTEDVMVIQINFTYGLSKIEKYKETKRLEEYKMQTNERKLFVKNGIIYEYNMDKIMDFWYGKDTEKIEEYKYLIMLDLKLAELNTLAKNDRMVEKYMSELESLNEDPKFREYMTVEEDRRKCYNSDMRIAREEGIKQSKTEIAKSLLKSSMTIEEIVKHTGLTMNEIEKIKEDN